MINLAKRYSKWIHTGWPAGLVEKMPIVNEDGTTAVAGLYVVGDLTGIPLLKLSADSGAKAVGHIAADHTFQKRAQANSEIVDIAIVGAGVSGMAAALEAKKLGLSYQLIEAAQPFNTIVNFPQGKPIFTYPSDLTPAGDLQFSSRASQREGLLEELQEQTLSQGIEPTIAHVDHVEKKGALLHLVMPKGEDIKAHRVIIAIGRSGNYRRLGVPGEDLPKVSNRLHDPKLHAGQNVLVVGGGDSALEGAIAMAKAGANVTLSYRKPQFNRPKPDNIEELARLSEGNADGAVHLEMASSVESIAADSVRLKCPDETKEIENDAAYIMIGREAPLEFFRRSGVPILGESTAKGWIAFALFMLLIIGVYDWKGDGFLESFLWGLTSWPQSMPDQLSSISTWWQEMVSDRSSLIGTLAVSMKSRPFYYTAIYSLLIGIFGYRRIMRRRTPYVFWQTLSLFLVQFIPLFLLPELLLPYLGYNGAFDGGLGASLADNLFPSYISSADYAAGLWPEWGHPRAYWKAYGLILAWPLSVYNVFTDSPQWAWIGICFVQTFVLLPLAIRRWGKGVYCGWICSCGGLAETLGDTQRQKMPHGPKWNKLNLVGQGVLAIAFVMLFIRIGGWVWPDSWMHTSFRLLLEGKNAAGELVNPVSYKWVVDIFLGGVIGVGLYFKYSGRVWCRFACPLAALMHIYARFTKFRILSEKKKCISCNVCTTNCHMGIDIMSFANKGLPMEDPECVRCSACVQTCPTGVLSFGTIDLQTGETTAVDRIAASRVKMAEKQK